MRTPHGPDRPWFLRPGVVAASLSLLVHAGFLVAALWLPHTAPTPKHRSFEIDAYLLDEEAEAPKAELPGEERSDVFRFADTGPEPVDPPEDRAPATLSAADGAPQPGVSPAAPAGGAAAGRAQGSSLFRPADRARAVVYIIDRSISMGLRGSLESAKGELLVSLERLPSTTLFQVLFYNREAKPLTIAGCGGLLSAGEEVRHAVAAAVAEVQAEGSTNHVAALRRALALGPEVICLVTDADDLTAEQVREVTRLNRGRAAIHAVHLGAGRRPAAEAALRALAAANGGTYQAMNPEDLR